MATQNSSVVSATVIGGAGARDVDVDVDVDTKRSVDTKWSKNFHKDGTTDRPLFVPVGKFTLILGCMFACKTTEGIRELRRRRHGSGMANAGKAKCVVVLFENHVRYGHTTPILHTHDDPKEEEGEEEEGKRGRGFTLHGLDDDNVEVVYGSDLTAVLRDNVAAFSGAQCVLVDEGQFFTEVTEGIECLMARGVDVVVTALSGTALREPWASVSEMIPLATEIRALSAICSFVDPCTHVRCANDASNTKLLAESDGAMRTLFEDCEGVVPGGDEIYMAVCDTHHPRFAAYTEEASSFTHEGGQYCLTKLLLQSAALPVAPARVADLAWVVEESPDLSERRIARADLTVPVLVSLADDGRPVTLDGFHRLAAAMRAGLKTLPARRVPPAMLESVRLVAPCKILSKVIHASP